MLLEEFGLERFFARWEFAAEMLLCASDVEGWPMRELLDLAGEEDRRRWDDLRLGYTESAGDPALRSEIAGLYERVQPDDVLVFAGAEEAVFALHNVLLGSGDHALVVRPAYQSLAEVAHAAGAEVSRFELKAEASWRLDTAEVRAALRPNTRLILVNEVYRFLEFDPADRLPAGADVLESGVSIGVMSKSFGLAGLRIGWIATRDRELLARLAAFKDYTTICSSAPSEVLALIALRARDRVLARNRGIVLGNLPLLDAFFARWPGVFEWIRPRGGSIGFPRLAADIPIDRFAADLVRETGVLLLPGTVFGDTDNRFRIGFGRTNMPAALDRLEDYARRTLR